MIFAFILIIVGLVFFLKNVGLITISWSVIWPIVVMGLGVYVAVISRKVSKGWSELWNKMLK